MPHLAFIVVKPRSAVLILLVSVLSIPCSAGSGGGDKSDPSGHITRHCLSSLTISPRSPGVNPSDNLYEIWASDNGQYSARLIGSDEVAVNGMRPIALGVKAPNAKAAIGLFHRRLTPITERGGENDIEE